MNQALISLDKIEVLGLAVDRPEPAIETLPERFRSIELRGVTYRYESPDGSGFVLNPINLTVRPGEVLFAAGGNGSGKTTLAKLLTGLYEPHDGQVLLDGVPVTVEDRPHYRQLFSSVFVEGHLFDRLLGVDLRGCEAELQQWSSLLGIDSKVDIESGRLITDKVSRGQQKRLALLVACLDDRPVFVLDEWAAEQDPEFKDIFYQRIVPELKARGKAVVAITHDDRYFFAADQVVKLVDGHLDMPGEKAA